MGFNHARNQYVQLSETLPALLYSAQGRTLTEEEIGEIKKKIPLNMPLFVELGSGSGGHLNALAEKNPNAFFVGFELRFKRAYKTAEKAEKKSLANLFVIRANAQELKLLIPASHIDGIYINFPDPWARHRWKKHRLINPDSLKIWHDLLKPQGFIRYKTDHLQYFQDTVKLITSTDFFTISKQTEDLDSSIYLENNIKTEFEKLFKFKGLPISFLEALKN